MIAIVDYGIGNLFSLQSSLKKLDLEAEVTRDEKKLKSANKIILPGVGAFGDAMNKLKEVELVELVRELANSGKPFLGICLGMQLLFDKGYEFGEYEGLGLISGEVYDLETDLRENGFDYKVPHIGWNNVIIKKESPLLKYTNQGDSMYYVHSYHAKNCEENTIITSEYGIEVVGAVQKDNIYGTQFHPEKSGEVGLKMLKAFGEVK